MVTEKYKFEKVGFKNFAEAREFYQAVMGMLLGDGWININRPRYKDKIYESASLRIVHCEKQRDYILHKAKILSKLTAVYVTYKNRYDKRTNKFYPCYRMTTSSHQFYKRMRHLFYPNGKKIVPDICRKMGEIGLFYLYLDDGSAGKKIIRNKEYFEPNIATNAFRVEDVEIIRKVFGDYDVKTSIWMDGTQPKLHASTKGFTAFINRFHDRTPECMRYKVQLPLRNGNDNACIKV
jgi:hypothetical protein